jgi:peptide-methionine (S)-S-oxide reductase
MNNETQTAVLGGGCFWCTEAVYKQLRGVISVTSGYAGGEMDNPNYDQVSMGRTGHAEVIKAEFDPSQVSFRDLLEVFFAVHDPTTLNKQGNDVGEEYRSIILYTDEEQKQQAEAIIKELEDARAYEHPIVTEVKPFEKFFRAEDYHQNYLESNPNQPYCQLVINPKIKKFKEKFASLLKAA